MQLHSHTLDRVTVDEQPRNVEYYDPDHGVDSSRLPPEEQRLPVGASVLVCIIM